MPLILERYRPVPITLGVESEDLEERRLAELQEFEINQTQEQRHVPRFKRGGKQVANWGRNGGVIFPSCEAATHRIICYSLTVDLYLGNWNATLPGPRSTMGNSHGGLDKYSRPGDSIRMDEVSPGQHSSLPATSLW